MATAMPACGAAGYTDPAAFAAAAQSYGFQLTVGFDSQASGSSAAGYGMLGISGSGLASDGETAIALTPVATDEYPAVSVYNSMGAAESQEQFLSGNSDVIVFNLAAPVHAFGLYLVGNPSPTGEPEIPFWRMTAPDIDFGLYSTTMPLQNLHPGSDVYFMGIVSPGQPFSQVRLESDNDPAAAFSFSVDSIAVATAADKVSIREAKELDSGNVVISDVAVMRTHSGRINVEETDRSAGIAVLGSNLSRGLKITFLGAVERTGDDEQVLRLIHLIDSAVETSPGSILMNTRAVGGGAGSGKQPGCTESVGPNNIGLDVTICGKVSAIGKGGAWMMVDDGAGRGSGLSALGVKVIGQFGSASRYAGETVRVTGSCSLSSLLGEHFPLIRVASPGDVTHIY